MPSRLRKSGARSRGGGIEEQAGVPPVAPDQSQVAALRVVVAALQIGDEASVGRRPHRAQRRAVERGIGEQPLERQRLCLDRVERGGGPRRHPDRKSVGSGKSVSVPISLGGRSITKKKTNKTNKHAIDHNT